jgi:molybdenum-dependent DNA-binding transcriptional regulator ModE
LRWGRYPCHAPKARQDPRGTIGSGPGGLGQTADFHAVADAGSLTHAGDTLHLSQSAVSRQIRALEENLNTTLFHRHARGLILTEQGSFCSTPRGT